MLSLVGVEVKKSGGGCRSDFGDFSAKEQFLTILTCLNRSKTTKNGFYVENQGRKLYFLDFKHIVGDQRASELKSVVVVVETIYNIFRKKAFLAVMTRLNRSEITKNGFNAGN